MLLDATDLDYAALNEEIKQCGEKVRICNCLGQRFIGAGLSGKDIMISGIPGNALGAYLNGAEITVHGNAQDAVGDTMNAGKGTGDPRNFPRRGIKNIGNEKMDVI